jgi:hypothetical protein
MGKRWFGPRWNKFEPPTEEEKTLNKGDPFRYGKKSPINMSEVERKELRHNRSKDYRKHSIGTPLTIFTPQDRTTNDELQRYSIVEPHVTKKGTVYRKKKHKNTVASPFRTRPYIPFTAKVFSKSGKRIR